MLGATNSNELNITNPPVNISSFVFAGVQCGSGIKILQTEVSTLTDEEFFKDYKGATR